MSLSNKRPADQNHTSLKGVHVLVVEDSWQVAKALKSALEQVGMDVSGPAATTAEARHLIAERMPRVAVVDVNLKREMAYGLIDELYQHGISVVVMSGYAVPFDLGGQGRSHPAKAIRRAGIVDRLARCRGESPTPLRWPRSVAAIEQ